VSGAVSQARPRNLPATTLHGFKAQPIAFIDAGVCAGQQRGQIWSKKHGENDSDTTSVTKQEDAGSGRETF
jgi:hypothetical protein